MTQSSLLKKIQDQRGAFEVGFRAQQAHDFKERYIKEASSLFTILRRVTREPLMDWEKVIHHGNQNLVLQPQADSIIEFLYKKNAVSKIEEASLR